MDSEAWGTAGFGVLVGGAGALGKLNTAAREAAFAETLPKLSENAVWEDYAAPSEIWTATREPEAWA